MRHRIGEEQSSASHQAQGAHHGEHGVHGHQILAARDRVVTRRRGRGASILRVGVGVDRGDKLPSGGFEVTHGTQVLAIDGSDEAPVYWSADVSQSQLTRDVLFLLDEG